MPYPVTLRVEREIEYRNRITTALRIFLAIPHLILVGGLGIAWGTGTGDGWSAGSGDWGIIGVAVGILAVVSWFTILISGEHIAGIRQLTRFYMRWRARAMAYLLLLTDAYPPFGDGGHTVSLEIEEPPLPRDRGSVAVRFFLLIPHLLALVFISIALCFTSIVAWFAILLTGSYPAGLYDFGLGALRWRMRVDAYALLLVDQYPPFSLE